mgnify:CR=1 FL=1
MKGAWWWNKEVKEKIKVKQDAYIDLRGSGTEEEKEVNIVQYEIAKREAKKLVTIAKNNAYKRLY